jgi:ABC-type branched-subunit amino acid transport system permease subunit
MVIIGGMRNLLGPALGALFFICFASTCRSGRPIGCCYFGLLFVAFVVFSPTGLVGFGSA